ncbi:MAG: ribonuclease R [Gemmatales bacterium]|nr:ribonuclease R [Gemmatales bacterium]MDW7994516.1 ribonuclease R [Gemmatales bacterium]
MSYNAMPMKNLAETILQYVKRPNYQPVKVKVLARKLGIAAEAYAEFRRTVKELIQQGQLAWGRNHVVRLANAEASEGTTLIGVFHKTAAGFGFVRPHGVEKYGRGEIFIPSDQVGDAATGDEVLVRLTRRAKGPERGLVGRIVRVVERASHHFVGTYVERGGEGFVIIDGTQFSEPIWVGDAGAKNARPENKVVVEIIRFPAPGLPGEGVITEVLGPRGAPGVDTLSVIRAFQLPVAFSAEALAEAREQAARFSETNLRGREDFTNWLTITIDPEDARDFDDAISLTYDSHRRHWHLGVHIADVAYFVPPGSALDREARERGNSVYLPQRVLPMLPEVLSNHLASLQQGRVRYVKSVLLEFTQHGQRVRARFTEAAIRVARRLTYTQVQQVLEGAPEAEQLALPEEIRTLLLRMRDLALILRERRKQRGALELYIPEVELEYDAEGRVCGAHYVPHDVSHQIIEEFMLAANEAVAEHLQSLGVPFLRRIHAPPAPHKLREFAEFVRKLGYDIDPRYATDRFQLQRVLEQSRHRPEVHAVHYALLRSLKQAEYSPIPEGHYALASEHYCHFTSPIRRYPDLIVHRLLGRWLHTGKVSADEQELLALGAHCSHTERRADEAERELIRIKLLDFLSQRIGMELDAIITGVEPYGFFAQSPMLPVDGLVHISSLTDDYYYHDESTYSLVGRRTKRRFRLGDRVRVKVVHVDLYRHEVDFRLADTHERGRSAKRVQS